MLRPLSWGYQPFRFLGIEEDDQHRMQAAFQSGIYRNIEEEEWIEQFRAATVNWVPPPQKHFFRAVLATVTLATLVLGSVIYAFSAHLR
jgi:hypothetical protein